MAAQLRNMSKKVSIIDCSPVSKKYRFLSRWKDIKTTKPKEKRLYDAAIFLDVPNTKRASWVSTFIKGMNIPILNIDHHISNTLFGNINYVDKEASSACECIYSILKALDIEPTLNICKYLATGIITDTGMFSFKNTSAKTFKICSELSISGVNFYSLSNHLYNTKSLESIQLLSSVLSTIKLKSGTVFIQLSQKMLEESGAKEEESEGFINFALSIKNTKVAVFFREKANGETRVSLRSKDEKIDVNLLANKFGGGGHKKAAGFRSKKNARELEQEILNILQTIK